MESEKEKEIKKALEDHSIEKLKYQDGIKIKEIDFIDILLLINELESENNELKKYRCDWLNSEKMHLQADLEDTEFELGCANNSLKKVIEENQQLKDRIAELEDKIESGYMKEFPCKVGDTVYCLIAQGRFGTVYTTGEAIARVVTKIIWDGKHFEIYSEPPRAWSNSYSECNFYGYWGDTVFATEKEANEKLNKIRGIDDEAGN